MSNKLPENLFYNKDYSWVKIEGSVATLGIISSATEKVKEFVFIDLPKKGVKIKKGDTYVSLEALKWSGHLGSPFNGEIIEVNDQLFDEPEIINKDPFGDGWIIKIKIDDVLEVKDLLKASEATEWIENNTKNN